MTKKETTRRSLSGSSAVSTNCRSRKVSELGPIAKMTDEALFFCGADDVDTDQLASAGVPAATGP